MKTAVSVPDQVFKRADKLAKRLKISRSRLYSEAVSAYVAQYDDSAVTEAIDRVCDNVDTSLPRDMADNARRMLRKVDW